MIQAGQLIDPLTFNLVDLLAAIGMAMILTWVVKGPEQ